MIATQLTGSDPFVQQQIAQLGVGHGRTLTDPVLVKAEGVQLLAGQATQQASVLADVNEFQLISMLPLAALLVHAAIETIRVRRAAHVTRAAPEPAGS
jgi:hypothetical protein